MRHPLCPLLVPLMLVAVLPCRAAADTPLAVKAGKIITLEGAPIENGILLIGADGRIQALGTDVEVPEEVLVVDESDSVIVPGLIEAHTSRGLDRANEKYPVTPFLTVYESVTPTDTFFEDALRSGITTIGLFPGNAALIAGEGIAVKPIGTAVEHMLLAPNVAMKLSFAPPRGTSRMAWMARLRQVVHETNDYREQQEQENGEKEPDPKKEPLVELLDGKKRTFVYCQTSSDVLRAIDFVKKYKLPAVFVLGREAYHAAAQLAKAKLPAVLDPDLEFWEVDEATHEEVLREAAKLFHEAGVRFALASGSTPSSFGHLWYQAAIAIRQGVPTKSALEAITRVPAELLGLQDLVGSLAPGKLANFVVLTGEPFAVETWIDKVYIEGRKEYDLADDEKMRELLGEE